MSFKFNSFIDGVYAAQTNTDAKAQALTTLINMGRSEAEAELVLDTLIGLAGKAKDADHFSSIVSGDVAAPVALSASEMQVLAGGIGNATVAQASAARGSTWQGNGGRTWEGSSR